MGWVCTVRSVRLGMFPGVGEGQRSVWVRTLCAGSWGRMDPERPRPRPRTPGARRDRGGHSLAAGVPEAASRGRLVGVAVLRSAPRPRNPLLSVGPRVQPSPRFWNSVSRETSCTARALKLLQLSPEVSREKGWNIIKLSPILPEEGSKANQEETYWSNARNALKKIQKANSPKAFSGWLPCFKVFMKALLQVPPFARGMNKS